MSSVVRYVWPFRTGNDSSFGIASRDDNAGDVYAALRSQPPLLSFHDELQRYTLWRRQRGLLQSVLPTAAYSGLVGGVVGVFCSSTENRYVSRNILIARYASTYAVIGACAAGVHTALLLRNNFEDRPFYPFVAGSSAFIAVSVMTEVSGMRHAAATGLLTGGVYTIGCLAAQWWRDRHMYLFLQRQQRSNTPVHRLAPELQLLYRAYLYDNRPLDERSVQRRSAQLIAHDASADYRLSAANMLNNLTPELWYWVSFPPWWPFRSSVQSDDNALALKRYYDDQAERAVRSILATDDKPSTPSYRPDVAARDGTATYRTP